MAGLGSHRFYDLVFGGGHLIPYNKGHFHQKPRHVVLAGCHVGNWRIVRAVGKCGIFLDQMNVTVLLSGVLRDYCVRVRNNGKNWKLFSG